MPKVAQYTMQLDTIFSVLLLVGIWQGGRSSQDNNVYDGIQRNPRENFFVIKNTPYGFQATLDRIQSRESCQDTHPNCPMWGDHGECQYNPNYMVPSCPYTCNTCHTGVSNNLFHAQDNNNGFQGNNNNNNNDVLGNNNNNNGFQGNNGNNNDVQGNNNNDIQGNNNNNNGVQGSNNNNETVNGSAANALATRQGGFAGEEVEIIKLCYIYQNKYGEFDLSPGWHYAQSGSCIYNNGSQDMEI